VEFLFQISFNWLFGGENLGFFYFKKFIRQPKLKHFKSVEELLKNFFREMLLFNQDPDPD
jgi:hypothetical protein